ncbi:MAG: hypothetical protein MI784_18260 [Cytophagales bacterium]|nr:hypothetical protein [Cytophagales bacterium]
MSGKVKIRLSAKLLKSGNIQVKFHVEEKGEDLYYGYLLANGSESMSEVVGSIRSKVREAQSGELYHRNLLRMGTPRTSVDKVLVYKKAAASD